MIVHITGSLLPLECLWRLGDGAPSFSRLRALLAVLQLTRPWLIASNFKPRPSCQLARHSTSFHYVICLSRFKSVIIHSNKLNWPQLVLWLRESSIFGYLSAVRSQSWGLVVRIYIILATGVFVSLWFVTKILETNYRQFVTYSL
jgi:hypothetical protein